MRKSQWIFISFFGGSYIALFFNLWGRSLENHDYFRYAVVVKEMILSNDWIVPRYNGEIFLHKPPFLFWLIAVPSKIYGSVTPFLARTPSAFFAWIGGMVVYLWGRKIWDDDRGGIVSSGILISSYLYFWQGRIARTDMVFSVIILLSLYFFYLSYQKPAKRSLFLTILSFCFIGMACLTKGPVGILFPLLTIFLFLWKQKRLGFLIRRDFLLGYLIVLLLSGFWIIPFLYRVGLEEALRIWQEIKILTRHRHAPFYLYAYRIWIDFSPWSIFLPSLLFLYWGKDKNQDEQFLILWFLSFFLLLTLFPYRASKYLLPAFPPLALLMGGFWRKKSPFLFGVILSVALISWHGYEYLLIQKNGAKTNGPILYQELKPYQGKDILGYQMDVDTFGKINFYGDKIIPQVQGTEDLKRKVEERGEFFIITPELTIRDLIKEGFQVIQLKKIDHRDENLTIVKIQKF